jgi:hypothetical protein
MSYKLKIVSIDKVAKIQEHLKDGYEPFAVNNERDKEGKPITKIYLKKSELSKEEILSRPILSEVYESELLKKFYSGDNIEKLGSFISQAIVSSAASYQRFTESEENANVTDLSLDQSDEQNDTLLNGGHGVDRAVTDEHGWTQEDYEKLEREDVKDSLPDITDRPEKKEDATPAGDGYRVVDSAPIATPQATPEQDGAVTEIKRKEKVNITRSPLDSEGRLLITARNKRFLINPDGTYSQIVTTARTGMSGGE